VIRESVTIARAITGSDAAPAVGAVHPTQRESGYVGLREAGR
jgi:hypothetical protein